MSFLIWGLILFFTGLYFSLIFNRNVWEDEVFSIQLIEGGIKEITSGTAADVHPPLYYYWAKLFQILFGDSIQVYKIASIIPMVALFCFGGIKIRKLFGDGVAFLFILFLACIPCSMEFAVQLRMYTMAILFVTMSGVYAYCIFIEGRIRNYVLFVATAVLAAYTHYFALASVMVIYGLLFIVIMVADKRKLKAWFFSVLAALLLYMPWLLILIKQIAMVNRGYWIPKITLKTIWGYFTWAFEIEDIPHMVYLFLIILVAVGLYALISFIRHKDKDYLYAILCMLVPTLTAIGGVLVSVVSTPIYRDQYVFPSMGLLALSFALGLKAVHCAAVIPISCFLLLIGAFQYKENFILEYRSTMVDYTYNYLYWVCTDEDYIVYSWKYFDFMYEYYFKDFNLSYVDDFDFSSEFRNVWYFGSFGQSFDTGILEENDLEMEYRGVYGIEHGPFELYQIYRK